MFALPDGRAVIVHNDSRIGNVTIAGSLTSAGSLWAHAAGADLVTVTGGGPVEAQQ